MATRKLVLGSAASLLLSSALIAAAPVAAQSDPAQAYSAARAQYDSQLQDYTRKQQDYERERSDYNAKIYDYQRSFSTPPPAPDVVVVDRYGEERAVIVDDGPRDTRVIVTDPDDDVVVLRDRDDFTARLVMTVPPAALVRLEDMADVNYAFFNVPVVDASGLPVGHFRRVETKDPGDLVAVVTLNGSRRTISMLTEHVRLDPDRRIIIADMTAREIDLIPSGFPYG